MTPQNKRVVFAYTLELNEKMCGNEVYVELPSNNHDSDFITAELVRKLQPLLEKDMDRIVKEPK